MSSERNKSTSVKPPPALPARSYRANIFILLGLLLLGSSGAGFYYTFYTPTVSPCSIDVGELLNEKQDRPPCGLPSTSSLQLRPTTGMPASSTSLNVRTIYYGRPNRTTVSFNDASSQAGTGKIKGRIINNEQKGVPGVVVVVALYRGTEVGRGTSGKDGTYVISGLPKGEYKVRVIEPSNTSTDPVAVDVVVDEGSTIEISPITISLRDASLATVPTPTPSPKPTPLPRRAVPTPTPTPRPASPVITITPPSRPLKPKEMGEIAVELPQHLVRNWSEKIRVRYKPPQSPATSRIEGGYVPIVDVALQADAGLKLVLTDSGEKPLGESEQDWTFAVAPQENAQSKVAGRLVIKTFLMNPETGQTRPAQNPSIEIPLQLSVKERALTQQQSIVGSTSLGIVGLMSVGAGLIDLKGKVKLYFYAQMEEEVAVQKETTVQVTLSRGVINQIMPAVMKSATGVIDPQKKLIIQIIPKMNFEVLGEARVEFRLSELRLPQSFYFDLLPTHLGTGEVWVIIRQGQVSLVNLVLEPRIVAAKPAKSQRVKAKDRVSQTVDSPEPLHQLRIYELINGDEVSYLYDLTSPALGIVNTYRTLPLTSNRQRYVENIYREIENRWVQNRDDLDNFAEELRAYGGQLFSQLFPLELQQVLWEHRDEIKSIMVLASEPFIPWELVHLKPPGQQYLPDEERFLAQMGLIRWLVPMPQNKEGWPPLSLKIRKGRVCYVIPKYLNPELKLREAEKEAAFLKKTFDAVPVEPTPKPVRAIISKPGQFDLLHFACHGVAEHDNITNAKLILQDRENNFPDFVDTYLIATDVEQHCNLWSEDNRPIIIINACQIGRVGHNLSGIGGFAQAFVRGGAGVFVGTLWSVGDSPARTFTETFYTQLRKGSSLAEATIAARDAAKNSEEQSDAATWLAYVVYGNPHMKITVQNSTSGEPPVQ